MGAKQSKRSVDISGKEAEGAGEVVAAGGEGRVEQLADVDALKPQLNGDAHIHEQSEKEKQLDIGTPENEKDATTEKEGKEPENEAEKEVPVTNGDTEPKPENGDSPAAEEGKKPKKEKVKKKWSLRSISFSRKDKPKQEKKQKEEEPKTNGEPEKVPEEAAEATPENGTNEVAQEAKPETEVKDEKTPETPVTEPLTNGSSSPEEPKAPADEPAVPAAPAAPAAPVAPAAPAEPAPEPKIATEPEQLPVNGLSLQETPEPTETEGAKPEPETTEPVPAPEIPVKKEVCVEQLPVETVPPPLPANPPPSSVASFAATTMAPELTDASLANPAQVATAAPPAPDTDTTVDAAVSEPHTQSPSDVVSNNESDSKVEAPTANVPPTEETSTVNNENTSEATPEPVIEQLQKIETVEICEVPSPVDNVTHSDANLGNGDSVIAEVTPVPEDSSKLESNANETFDEKVTEISQDRGEVAPAQENSEPAVELMEIDSPISEESAKIESVSPPVEENLPESLDDLPPPPPLDDVAELPTDEIKTIEPVTDSDLINNVALNGDNTAYLNGDSDEGEKILKKKVAKEIVEGTIENGNLSGSGEASGDASGKSSGGPGSRGESLPPSPAEAEFPPPPAELSASQEAVPVSDKLADLIPEVPVVPELNTDTETTSDVAVAN